VGAAKRTKGWEALGTRLREGPRDGDRAPPRGVDVKPLAEPGLPAPAPGLEGPRRALRTVPGPRRGPPAPGRLGGPDSRTRPLRRGGFYINPSRRGPVPAGLVWGPTGPKSPETPKSGYFPKKALKRASRASPGPDPPDPENAGTGPRREGLM